jgi:hypothetical protein
MRRYALILIGGLLCLSACGSQSINNKITFECKGEPVSRVLQDLSKATGLHLSTDPDIGREVVIISVTDVPIRDVLTGIAKVTSGQWTDSYRLQNSPAQMLKQANDLTVKRVAFLRKEFVHFLTVRNPQGDMADFRNYDDEGNLAFFCGTALITADLSMLANLGPGQRVVYSSAPNSMQLALPALSAEEIRRFITAYNKDTTSLAARINADKSAPEFKVSPEKLASQLFSGMPSKVILTAGVRYAGQLSTHVYFVDSKGMIIRDHDRDFATYESSLTKDQPATKDSGKTLGLSPLAAEYMRICEKVGDSAKPSPELEAKLLRPDLYDPTSFGLSETILQSAKERKLQLIADVPDELAGPNSEWQKSSVESSMSALEEEGYGISESAANGWLYISPKEPALAREHRFNREALAVFLGKVHDKSNIRLDDLAEYALHSDAPVFLSPGTTYIGVFAPRIFYWIADQTAFNSYRFYGMMDSTQKDILAKGGSLQIGTLAAGQVELLPKIFFSPGVRLRKLGVSAFTKPPPLIEATEAMPEGVPGSLSITGGLKTITVVRAEPERFQMFGPGVMNADSFAFMQRSQDDPKWAIPKALKVGQTTTLALKFEIGNGIYLPFNFSDTVFPPNAPAVSAKDLPADFLAEAARISKKEAEDEHAFGQRNPPPRRR